MIDIFKIQTEKEFIQSCIETFQYQYQNIEVYRKFVDYLRINSDEVFEIEQIPFIPIETFKNHRILDQTKSSDQYFQSSGTTQMNLSKHWIADINLYEKSIVESFNTFIGNPKEYIYLGLLPSYLERQNSSLIHMVNCLMEQSKQPENGYFLYNHEELFQLLQTIDNKKVILFGVSFALLDFLDFCQQKHPNFSFNMDDNFIVIETGGMKGRKEEMTKDELLKILQTGFNTNQIFSEYSMTELLSQAYSLGENIYESPNWMRILIRNAEDPLSYVPANRSGAINIIDLANRHSCSFIATQDLGKVLQVDDVGILRNKFQVLGRIDHSDIRGCSLLVS